MTLRNVFGALAFASLALPTLQADEIPAQPIGFLGLRSRSSEPNDFFLEQAPFGILKLYFNIKLADLPRGRGESRAWMTQTLVDRAGNSYIKFVARRSPAVRVGTFVLPPDQKVTDFLQNSYLSGFPQYEPERMFFRVPGSGIYSTFRGGVPVRIAAETLANPIIGPAMLLPSYPTNFHDIELQGRLFFSGYNAITGREPYISNGAAAGTRVLKNIAVARRAGSNTGGFAALGGENEDQTAFFVADDQADHTSQLWQLTKTTVRRTEVYGATQFTSSVNAPFVGPITQIKSDGSALFFTAPVAASGNPRLFRMLANDRTVGGLVSFDLGNNSPQDLTLTTSNSSYSNMCFTVLDGAGTRRYARYSFTNDSAVILDGSAVGAFSDPKLITDAGQYFYVAGNYQGSHYVIKHDLADNSLGYVSTENVGGQTNFPFNIHEICVVTQDGTGGTLYFTADVYLNDNAGATPNTNVLFRMPANDVNYFAEVVRQPSSSAFPSGEPVQGAHNLRSVINISTPAMHRLYFAAPVSPTVNAFYSAGADQGVEPWVTEAP